ncbi:MAG: flagellin [Firmicutes bacterium]|nr:flagellin [Bacillota bacterium]
MIVQHNIPALNSYNRLGANNKNVAANLKKLSSGYKINSAADNAAGLAISEKMRAQITGLEACQQNAKDGISLVQTAEGALTEVHSMLNRMVELSTLASNGTYSDSNREKYQNEIQELKDEIDRIADSTNFNGINLLDGNLSGGSMKTDTAQLIGTDVSTSFEPETSNTATNVKKDLSGAGTVVASKETYNIDGQSLTIDWGKGDAKKLFDATIKQDHSALTPDGAKDIAEKLTELFNNEIKAQGLQGEVEIKIDGTGAVTMKSLSTAENAAIGYVGSDAATADQVKTVGTFFFGTGDGKSNVVTPQMKFNNTITANDKFTMTINGTTVEAAGFAAARGDDMETVKADLATAIGNAVDAYNAAMGYTAGQDEFVVKANFSVDVDKSGGFKVTYTGDNADKVNFSFGEKTENGIEGTAAKLLGLSNKVSTQGVGGNALSLQIGDTADEYNRVTVSIQDCHAKALGVAGIDVTTEASAAQGISKIKDAIDTVSKVRAKLGATQNRLDHTLNNLETTTENLTDAESRIRDTDMAKEMMQYTKNNILVQSSQAMLAQANQLPQGVLQLLQ